MNAPRFDESRPEPHRIDRRTLLKAAAALPLSAGFLAACSSGGDQSGGTTTSGGGGATTTSSAGVTTSSQSSTDTATATASSSTSSAVTSTSAKVDFTGVTLQLWSGATVAPPATKAAAEWAAKTGGKVNVTAVPFSERAIKFAGLISSRDSSIDLLYASGAFVAQFGDKLYEDLSAPNLAVDSSIYVPGTLPIMSNNGKLLALPMHSEVYLYIYNKTMFAAAGLNPDSPPATWDEYYAASAKLRSGNRYPCAATWAATTSSAYYLCYLNSIAGAKLLSDDRTQVLFDNDAGLKAFQEVEAGMKSGFFMPNIGADVDDYGIGKMFNSGQIASMINFSELWGYAVGSDPKDFPTSLKPEEVGVGTLPGVTAGTTGSVNGYEGFGINKFSTKKEAALNFLSFATGHDFQMEMNLAKTLPSSNTAVLNSPEVEAVFPVGSVIAKQGAGNVDRYGAPYNWEPPVAEALRKLYAGQITAAQAHDAAVAGVKKVLQDYLT